jgi:hypothetical protein
MNNDPSRQSPASPESRLDFWTRLADQRIGEAQAAGAFDQLPGFGQPLATLDEPYDENQWVREKLRREDIACLPPSLAILRDVEKTLERLAKVNDAQEAHQALKALNERIRVANFHTGNGPPSTQMPLDIPAYLAKWEEARRGST